MFITLDDGDSPLPVVHRPRRLLRGRQPRQQYIHPSLTHSFTPLLFLSFSLSRLLFFLSLSLSIRTLTKP
ncbi:hypothetical protein RIF29_23821 [Crotalaria pallida]|uniref:Uncharacterized protein n=1 Tax=Crotalaria pallida TaxID=3830 RepID=A0AAN9IFD0_CROPI